MNRLFQTLLRPVISPATIVALVVGLAPFLVLEQQAEAACGVADRHWSNPRDARYSNRRNWLENNVPNTASENVKVISAESFVKFNTSATIGCLENISGVLQCGGNYTLTVTGDYFKNLISESMSACDFASAKRWQLLMAGSGAQTLENLNEIYHVRIGNNTEVTFTHPFNVGDLTFEPGWSGTLNINGNMIVRDPGFDFQIPSGGTVKIGQNVIFEVSGNMIIDGTLEMSPGSTLVLANSSTLTVSSGGSLVVNGSDGNIATIKTEGSGQTYSAIINGDISAKYFRFDRLDASGLQVNGSISSMNHGEWHYIQNGGYVVTFGPSATINDAAPSILDYLGFYDDDGHNNAFNFNATNYSGSVDITLDNWSGAGAGETQENGTDTGCTGGCFDWAGQAQTQLNLLENTAAGSPPNPIGLSAAETLFGTWAFSLTDNGQPATNITSVTISQIGDATNADIPTLKLYADDGTSACSWDVSDSLIGTSILTNTPGSATFAIPAGTVQTSGQTPSCVHLTAETGGNIADQASIQFEISNTTDVTNVRPGDLGSYAFSASSGPPVAAPDTIVSPGVPVTRWDGSNSDAWTRNANWQPRSEPTSDKSCKLGLGSPNPYPRLDGVGPFQCLNADFLSTGGLDFGVSSNTLDIYGNILLEAGFNFNVNNNMGSLQLLGSFGQTFSSLTTPLPLPLIVNKGASSDIVSFATTGTFNDTLTITNGVFRIEGGAALTAKQNIIVGSGGTLEIEPNGYLKMADGKSITVQSGGKLILVGTSSFDAVITGELQTSKYSVSIAAGATIAAQYYQFDQLGTAGVTIAEGATIDGTYSLQNGKWTYPVLSNTTMLTLNQPLSTLDNVLFDSSGSAATNVTNIATTGYSQTGALLTISNFSGDLSGPTYDNDDTDYTIVWSGTQANTIHITQDQVGTTSAEAGQTGVYLGRFGFQQALAGGFANTDASSLILTLNGTGNSGDVTAVNLYYDADCDSTAGTLISSQTLSGSPPQATFSPATDGGCGASSEFCIPADASSTQKVCAYVTADLTPEAVAGHTVGFKINSASHFANTAAYATSGSTVFPIELGTPATISSSITNTWNGGISTNWHEPNNWSSGSVPTSTENCTIVDKANDPVISAGATAQCKTLEITSGSLTLAAATSTLELFGDFINTSGGSFVQNSGDLRFRESSAITQSLFSSTTVESITFNKTAGGEFHVGTDGLTLNTLDIPSGSNFTFVVPTDIKLTLTNGLTLSNGTFRIDQRGVLRIPSGQEVLINGGTFIINGQNDYYDMDDGQDFQTKGSITNNGSGRWGFRATSGIVNLTGFHIDQINAQGLQIQGSTILAALDGGQFTNLAYDFSSPVRAIYFNTTGSVPSVVYNVGFNWGGLPNNLSRNGITWSSFNSYRADPGYDTTYCASGNCPLDPAQNYLLVDAQNCGGSTINFEQWAGDWFDGFENPSPDAKILDNADSAARTCTVSMAASASAVNLSSFYTLSGDATVEVRWDTTYDLNHKGFNVYKSTSPSSGYIKVNSNLIRDYNSPGSYRGSYRYADTNVVNGIYYYYMIEDVEYGGKTTLHGPVFARPEAGSSITEPVASDANSDSSVAGSSTNNGVTAGVIDTQVVDLGDGVHVLSKTNNTIRVEVIPPPRSFATASWNSSYYDLTVPGYSRMTEVGFPEMPVRKILVEVDSSKTTANLINSTVNVASPVSDVYKISPAPAWSKNFADPPILVADYAANSSAYSSTNYYPADYFSLNGELVDMNGKKFVEITIYPAQYQASTNRVTRVEKIILDIGLDGVSSWDEKLASTSGYTPAAIPNALRIRFKESGIYSITYEDMQAAWVDGKFAGNYSQNFRMYFEGNEIPIQVVDSDYIFGAGDEIRFYGKPVRHLEDDQTEYVLTTEAVDDSSGAPPKRMRLLDANPSSATPSAQTHNLTSSTVEQDNIALFSQPFGGAEFDRFFMTTISAYKGNATSSNCSNHTGNVDPSLGYPDCVRLDIDLPLMLGDNSHTAYVMIPVIGKSFTNDLVDFDVGLYVNDFSSYAAETSFSSEDGYTLLFAVPQVYFSSGTNTIGLQIKSENLPNLEFASLFVDRLQIYYKSALETEDDVMNFVNTDPGTSIKIEGFSASNIIAYDISALETTAVLSNLSVTSATDDEGTTSYATTFKTVADGEDDAFRYLVLDSSQLKKPDAMFLAEGALELLKDSSRQADMIIIGSKRMLSAAHDLIEHRESQGLNVAAVSYSQIYAEFSHGIVSSAAIKEFIGFAHENWTAPAAKYLLFIGDGTYDTRNRLGNNHPDAAPLGFLKGPYLDYAADNWFVEKSDSILPRMAVGRIPALEPAEVMTYVNKLLDYENGSRAPNSQGRKRFVVTNDYSGFFEGFERTSTHLESSIVEANSAFDVAKLTRTTNSDNSHDAELKGEIINSFTDGSLLMTYVGHGAEQSWADSDVFSNSDALDLTNEQLPIVMALNCLNSLYYDADPTYRSLGESLLFSENGGAVAFVGSTTMTLPTAQTGMAIEFINKLSENVSDDYKAVTIGEIFLAAKSSIPVTESNQDAIASFSLFGDPAARLPESVFQPEVKATASKSVSIQTNDPDTSDDLDDIGEIKTPTNVKKPSSAPKTVAKTLTGGGSGGLFGCGTVHNQHAGQTPFSGLLLVIMGIFLPFGMSLLLSRKTKKKDS